MNTEIENLMEVVIKENLETLQELDLTDVNDEGRKLLTKETLELTDRLIQLRRLDQEESDRDLKRELENQKYETNKDENVKNRVIRIIEVAAVPTVLFVADCLFKRYYMRSVCNFEKDYTFTTTPGRAVSGLFKFKK